MPEPVSQATECTQQQTGNQKGNTMPASKRQVSRKVSKQAASRWVELSGAKAPANPSGGVRALLTGLGALRHPGAANPANPNVVVTVRKTTGTGCEKRAEIAGFYERRIGPGQPCIGAAAVKAVLDAAAESMCCDTLQCPKECPCEYHPQQALALYRCANGMEEGYLLQEKRVWNCGCRIEL